MVGWNGGIDGEVDGVGIGLLRSTAYSTLVVGDDLDAGCAGVARGRVKSEPGKGGVDGALGGRAA